MIDFISGLVVLYVAIKIVIHTWPRVSRRQRMDLFYIFGELF